MATQIEPVMTVADLDLMPDDGNSYELIEGELFVSRAPSLNHQLIVKNIIVLFQAYLDRHPVGIVVPGPGVIFSDFNGVIPDVVFISNERRDEIAAGVHISGAPDIVIEIVSPGAENERRDRVAKRRLYGSYSVKEYWVVDGSNCTLEIYRLRKQSLKLVATLLDEDEITSSLLPNFNGQVSSMFQS